MTAIASLLDALDERTIAHRVGLVHDEARLNYRLSSNTVRDFDEFADVIGDYYNYHFARCSSGGGRLSAANAASRAKALLTAAYRRRGGDIVSAFNDAHDGTNAGMRMILDLIAEQLKAEAVEDYTREQFDRHVAPNSWENQVEIIREFIREYGSSLGSSIRADQPGRYARNYEDLIRSFVDALKNASSVFRRL